MSKILEVSFRAQEQVKFLLTNVSDKYIGIRVGIKSGGCSGFKYYIEYANDIHKYDEVITCGDASIIIDPKALMFVIGSKMDYVEEEFNEGFVFTNPNEKGRCGCGKSFSA